MTQYSSLNVKLSNSQPNKLKSAIKNELEVVLRLSSNVTGDDETNFPHKLLTNRQVANLRSAFAKKSSTDIKLSKSVLIPLGLTAAASAAEAGIYEKILDQGIIIQQH